MIRDNKCYNHWGFFSHAFSLSGLSWYKLSSPCLLRFQVDCIGVYDCTSGIGLSLVIGHLRAWTENRLTPSSIPNDWIAVFWKVISPYYHSSRNGNNQMRSVCRYSCVRLSDCSHHIVFNIAVLFFSRNLFWLIELVLFFNGLFMNISTKLF